MLKPFRALLPLFCLLWAAPAFAVSPNLVISQVYGGAGCPTAGCSTYKNDYIELFNRGAAAVNVNGWSVQYAAATGTSWQVTHLPNVSIPAGGYLLVAEGSGPNGVSHLPAPDVTGAIPMSATAGKVALLSSTTALSGACPTGGSLVDFAGYGTAANCNEGGANTPAPSTTSSVLRGGGGCTDTDNNGSDFSAAAASARNSASALSPCGGLALSVDDVSLSEGNAGTTSFTFTVGLSAPAGAGGVTFDIATADGTAAAPGDYTARSLTGQTIPAGSSAYSFTVLVHGDATAETDETFLVNLTNVTGAILADGQGQGTILTDDGSTAPTRIHDVQGNGTATPIPGATVTVEGVVVASFQGTDKLRGFFLQEEDADVDADPATSEGIFIFCSGCPTPVAEGQRVRVMGSVSEFNGLTEITASTAGSVVVTGAGNQLAEVTPASIDLPIAGVVDAFYEAREGMLVTFVDTLTVAEYFELARYGQIVLYEGGRPRQLTEASAPSVAGYNAHLDALSRREVILDDDDNEENSYLALPDGSQLVFHPRANGGFSAGTQGTDFFRGGDLVTGLTGVLHWSFPGFGADTWRIRPTQAHPVTFTPANPRPATPPAVGGAIQAAGINLLNYFTTIDTTSSNSSGSCGPSMTLDCRGADSVAELNRQRERTSIVICTLNADVAGLVELENTTPSAAITDLLGAVNSRCGGAHPYAFVNTGGTLGTDAIRVQLLYRTGILSPAGSPLVDLDAVHNRPLTAQTFDVVDAANPAFGERFTVIAGHFKSKGCPGTGADADAGDGQSCFNGRRVAQANRLLTWISGTVLPAAGDPDVLLLGDFNAYAQEDPVTAIEAGGYTDLEAAFQGAAAYSYLFDGQLGHLDYAFASASLLPQVTGADAWHINADEAPLFDYSDEVKDTGEATFEEKPNGSALAPPRAVFQPASPFRAADHDPVLVGLFHVEVAEAADLSVTSTDSPDPVNAGASLTYTITVTNAGPGAAAGAAWSDTLPAGTTFVSLPAVAGWSCTTGAMVSCSNPSLGVGSAVFTLTVAVAPSVAAGTVLSNTVTASATTGDPDTDDLSATATTTVAASADLSVTQVDTPDPLAAGRKLTYTLTVTNVGPSHAASVALSDPLPAGTTFVSLVSPGGWTCTKPAVGVGGTVSCSIASLAPGSAGFTLVVAIDPSAASGTVLSNTATVTSTTADPSPGDESSTAETTVSNLGNYFTLTPCRAVNTRTTTPLQHGVSRTFALHGVCGIPATATSVLLNITAVLPTGSGEVAIQASDIPAVGFSTLPFRAGTTRALFAIVQLSNDAAGGVTVRPSVAGNGSVHLMLDVMGYFE